MSAPSATEAMLSTRLRCSAAPPWLAWPVVLGLTLLGYAVNVFIFSMGRLWQDAAPILTSAGRAVADPLPQALVLTAIVIGFATTAFVIQLALRTRYETGSDHVDGHEPFRGASETRDSP
jgi:multicomponent K+:H+ antiporter subunit C